MSNQTTTINWWSSDVTLVWAIVSMRNFLFLLYVCTQIAFHTKTQIISTKQTLVAFVTDLTSYYIKNIRKLCERSIWFCKTIIYANMYAFIIVYHGVLQLESKTKIWNKRAIKQYFIYQRVWDTNVYMERRTNIFLFSFFLSININIKNLIFFPSILRWHVKE